MKEKDLDDTDKLRIKNYKKYFIEWFEKNAPSLSQSSVKLYSRSVALLAIHLIPPSEKDIDIDKMLNAVSMAYDLDDEDLSAFSFDDNLNNLNTNLNGLGKLIKVAKMSMDDFPEKLIVLEEHIRKVSVNIREEIIRIKGSQKKNEQEEQNMKPFNKYVEEAEKLFNEYKQAIKKAKAEPDFEEGIRSFLPKLKFRNIILVSLILLNKMKMEGKTLHSILRLVEYTDLILWKEKEKPPADKKNYFSIPDKVIYIQHNKTTGGLKTDGKMQSSLKKFRIYNKKIVDMIELYDKVYEIGHNEPLFTSTHATNGRRVPLNKTALSKLLNVIFQDIADHTTIGLIRKSYDTTYYNKLNWNQKKKSAKLNDHSPEVVETYYNKI